MTDAGIVADGHNGQTMPGRPDIVMRESRPAAIVARLPAGLPVFYNVRHE